MLEIAEGPCRRERGDHESRYGKLMRRCLSSHEAIVVFALGILLLLPCVWTETSITGQDEYWLSLRTPMETLERGDWITTWVNREPRLRKPPLLYWALMVSYRILGINLFAARIWGVLAGAGLAACSCLLYRALFKRSGMLAGLITLATVAVAVESRMAILDLPLAFLTCMAVYFALRWGQSAQLGWALVSALFLGLSFLLKGPVGFFFFGAAAIGALFVFGWRRLLISYWSHVAWAILVLIAVCVPWPLAMAYLWPDFLAILDQEIAARQFGLHHLGDIFSTVGGAIALVFPWSILLIAAFASLLKHIRDRSSRQGLWLAIWFFGGIIPFFFIYTFGRYMTPVIPAASVLCAYWLERGSGPLRSSMLMVTVSLIAGVCLALCLFCLWFGHGIPTAIACLLMVGLMFWVTLTTYNAHLVAGSVALLLTLTMGGLYPSLGINAMPEEIEEIVGGAPVASYNSSQPSMLSMRLKRSAIQLVGGIERFDRVLQGLDGFVFVRERDVEGFEAHARRLGIHFEHLGQFSTLYSRHTWVRFAREDATIEDWKKAAKAHSLAGLKSNIHYYRVCPEERADG
jgi:4-amino-4-deoxy-L-arabinose transferase-like glycosyltransferase